MKNMEGVPQNEIDLIKKLEKIWGTITRFCKQNKGAVLMIIITIWILIFMYFLSYFYYNKKSPTPEKTEIDSSQNIPNYFKYPADTISEEIDLPILDLPLRYFPDVDTQWGAVNTGRDSDDKNTWRIAAMEGGARSFPTTTVTISSENYSSEISSLPPVKTREEIRKEDTTEDGEEFFNEYKDELFSQYGSMAGRFLSEGYAITEIEEFDVDNDGKTEKIISLCGVGGNHCPHEIIIIKNEKIIFSTTAGMTGLELAKSETGNGFYVHWVPTTTEGKWQWRGLCCPIGYINTRFVFEEGVFKPVYEQEVIFFQVNNTE